MAAAAPRIAVLGAGLAGCSAALELSRRGHQVTLLDKAPRPMMGASRHNEGKLHLGYVYAADRTQRTARTVMRGSQRFLGIIERLTGVAESVVRRSGGFTYIVPHNSQLDTSQLSEHFAHVDSELCDLHRNTGRPQLAPTEQLAPAAWSGIYACVQGAFRTPEIAVDPHHVAALVSAAVLADPNIDFKANHRVRSAGRHGTSAAIELETLDGSSTLQVDATINALWEDRVFIDETAGVPSDQDWMWRWKATIALDADLRAIPPTTAILGAFGDIVPFGPHRTYLSWYPACNIGLTNEIGSDPLHDAVSQINRSHIVGESIAGMATLIPSLASVPLPSERAIVQGGYIMAVGTSDIDDVSSRLHERHLIGPEAHERWITLETGKYCTAPLFGVEAAEMLSGQLGSA